MEETPMATNTSPTLQCKHPNWPLLSCDEAEEQIGIAISSLSHRHRLSFQSYRRLLDRVNRSLSAALDAPRQRRAPAKKARQR
jgi:hypothetical protein